MKDSSVLKKLFLFCSIISVGSVSASDLQNYLSSEKNQIFNYQNIKNNIESDKLHNSWISPITASYQENWTTQPVSGTKSSGVFSIGINQPIFKSGGIYYAIKYSSILRGVNAHGIRIKKRALIAQAINILYSIKELKLQKRKLQLLISNDNIDIKRKQESYNAGVLDSSFLDQSILKQNGDKLSLLDIESNLAKLKNSFHTLSKRNPDRLKTPHLRLITLNNYKNNNMNVIVKRLEAKENKYKTKMVWSKYLPTISANARYSRTDKAAPGNNKNFYTYGLTVSMPLSINSVKDIESSRVSYLQSMVELQDSRRGASLEYSMVRENLRILNKKIALSKKNEALYRNLYKRTKDSVKAGEKTNQDEQIMLNSLKIQKISRAIYYIKKQEELLKLYTKVGH